MIRYLLMSIICILHSACPLPPQFCIDFCFQIPKGYQHNTLCKMCGANRVHYVGFENSQWEGGECAPVTPLPHYSPLRSHGIFLASHIREFWSRKYPLRACLHQKDRTLVYLLRVLFILLFCKICFLCLTVKPSASRSLSKCRPRGFKSENIE